MFSIIHCPIFTTRALLALFCLAGTLYAQSTTSMLSQSKVSETYFSYISGPILEASSWNWQKILTPVTVGTVTVAVDNASKRVGSRTVFHSDYANFANLSLFDPTGTNTAGIRTVSDV